MTGTDKKLVLVAFVNLAIYAPIFLGVAAFEAATASHVDWLWRFLIPWHFLGMLLMVLALYVTLKDLFTRPFDKPASRFVWLALVLATGGIGWIAYLFRHGFRPRMTAIQV